MMLGGEEGLECEVCIDGIHLEHVSECKYLGCGLDESGTDEPECSRKVASWKRVLLGLWLMTGVCSLSVQGSCTSHCWCLFLHMVLRQYGGRRRGL